MSTTCAIDNNTTCKIGNIDYTIELYEEFKTQQGGGKKYYKFNNLSERQYFTFNGDLKLIGGNPLLLLGARYAARNPDMAMSFVDQFKSRMNQNNDDEVEEDEQEETEEQMGGKKGEEEGEGESEEGEGEEGEGEGEADEESEEGEEDEGDEDETKESKNGGVTVIEELLKKLEIIDNKLVEIKKNQDKQPIVMPSPPSNTIVINGTVPTVKSNANPSQEKIEEQKQEKIEEHKQEKIEEQKEREKEEIQEGQTEGQVKQEGQSEGQVKQEGQSVSEEGEGTISVEPPL